MSACLAAPPKETDWKWRSDAVDHMACVINGTDYILACNQSCSSHLCNDPIQSKHELPTAFQQLIFLS